jgi:hypothetical protein
MIQIIQKNPHQYSKHEQNQLLKTMETHEASRFYIKQLGNLGNTVSCYDPNNTEESSSMLKA